MDADYHFKIIFVGDQYVGKSSIIKRFYCDKFESEYKATIGLDFSGKNVYINDSSVRLLLYDTAGQEKFKPLIPMYMRDADIIIIVYDISNKDSFNHCLSWLKEVNNLKGEDIIRVLIGNKIDLENEKREVEKNEAEKFAKENGCLFCELSAKTGEQLEKLFSEQIFQELAKKFEIHKEKIEETKIHFNKDEEEQEEDKKSLENENRKCSLDEHNEIDAKSFCQECKIYMCNKCKNIHSGLCKKHHTFELDENINDIFTGICQKKITQ